MTNSLKESLVNVIAQALTEDTENSVLTIVENAVNATGLRRATWATLTHRQRQMIINAARSKQACADHPKGKQS